jgi:hypothetical protein
MIPMNLCAVSNHYLWDKSHASARRYTKRLLASFALAKLAIVISNSDAYLYIEGFLQLLKLRLPSADSLSGAFAPSTKKNRIFHHFGKIPSKNTRFVSSFYLFISSMLTFLRAEITDNKRIVEKGKFNLPGQPLRTVSF